MDTREMESASHDLMMQAVMKNNKAALMFLLAVDSNLPLDYRNPGGKTALFLAVYYGRNELAEILLNAGANPNIQNDWGWTPLMQARFQRNFTMIKILLDAGADLSIKNLRGETIYEMDFGDSPLITPILLNDPMRLNQLLQKTILANYQSAIKIAIQLKRYTCLEILLEQLPDVNEENYLEKAFYLEDYVSFDLLLRAGANPNVKDEFENSLLHTAVLLKKHLFVKALLEHHANVNVPDKFGETPLMIAVKQKDAISIKALADKKPDLMIKNSEGENVISLIQKNHECLRASLQKNEKSPSIPKKSARHLSFFNGQSVTLMAGAFCAGLVVYHLMRSKTH